MTDRPAVIDFFPAPKQGWAWVHDANCRDTDPDAFFPATSLPSAVVYSVCSDCPVRQECLAASVQTNSYGVWAGTGAKTRQDKHGQEQRR